MNGHDDQGTRGEDVWRLGSEGDEDEDETRNAKENADGGEALPFLGLVPLVHLAEGRKVWVPLVYSLVTWCATSETRNLVPSVRLVEECVVWVPLAH